MVEFNGIGKVPERKTIDLAKNAKPADKGVTSADIAEAMKKLGNASSVEKSDSDISGLSEDAKKLLKKIETEKLMENFKKEQEIENFNKKLEMEEFKKNLKKMT